jgi:hypothetical protein
VAEGEEVSCLNVESEVGEGGPMYDYDMRSKSEKEKQRERALSRSCGCAGQDAICDDGFLGIGCSVRERAFDRKEGKRKESNSNELEKGRARAGGTGWESRQGNLYEKERGRLCEMGSG